MTGTDTIDKYLAACLRTAEEKGASDLHVKVGSPPRLRVNGELLSISQPSLTSEDTMRMARSTMKQSEWDLFESNWERDYSLDLPGSIARFRVNAYFNRGTVGMVLRRVNGTPPTFESLHLPTIISNVAALRNGLFVFAGATGSGKSTTLAAVVDIIMKTRKVHVVTIEDPIEFVHADKKASISQREISSDTKDFATALHSAMRQDPDIIVIGEMRNGETVRAALSAAETGHLVLSTLHSTSSIDAVNRIIDMVPNDDVQQTRQTMADALRGVVTQKLVEAKEGGCRVPVVEVLMNMEASRIHDAISDPDKYDLYELMKTSLGRDGIQTFDDHLFELVNRGILTNEIAQVHATNKHDLAVKLRARTRK